MSVIDGATNQVTATFPVGTPPMGAPPTAIAFNGVTNKVYVANSDGTVTVIDGSANSASTITVGFSPDAVAVNRATNEIAVASGNSSSITLITEQNVQTIPLSTTITPLPGNQLIGTAPPPASTFKFTTSSTYAPNAPPVEAVFFRLDTWRGPWVSASVSGNTFTCPSATCQFPAPLTVGPHILFAYAGDAQVAPANGLSSPVIGNITTYYFRVVPVQTVTTLTSGPTSPQESPQPPSAGASILFTATVTTNGTQTPTGTVTFVDGSTTIGAGALACVEVNNSCSTVATATFSISTLAPGPHSITAVYSGDANSGASVSSALSQAVGAQGTTTLLGANPNPGFQGGTITFTATVSGAIAGTPTGPVNFLNGTTVMNANPVALNKSGVATYVDTSVSQTQGTYSITAVYLGDSLNMTSTSSVLSVTVGAPSFVLSATPSTVTLTAGSTASYIVSVAPEGNFTTAVTLTCPSIASADSNVGLPASATCAFNPATVTPGTATLTSTCTIVTSSTAGLFVTPASRIRRTRPVYVLGGWLTGLALLTALMVDTLRKRRLGIFQRYAMGVLLMVALGLTLSSCGNPTSTAPATTATTGTFSLTFTGTAGSTTSTTTVSIVINAAQ